MFSYLATGTQSQLCAGNFRPFSNWPFISKLLENWLLAASQTICPFIFQDFQLEFRSKHSAEATLARAENGRLIAANSQLTSVRYLTEDTRVLFDPEDRHALEGMLLGVSVRRHRCAHEVRVWASQALTRSASVSRPSARTGRGRFHSCLQAADVMINRIYVAFGSNLTLKNRSNLIFSDAQLQLAHNKQRHHDEKPKRRLSVPQRLRGVSAVFSKFIKNLGGTN